MSDFINHPAMITLMTVLVGFQWFLVGHYLTNTGAMPWWAYVVTAAFTTAASISYQISGRRTARSQGRIEGLLGASSIRRGPHD